MRRITLSLLAIASLGLSTSAFALTATQVVEKETVITNLDGTQTIIREAAEMVLPGEKIIYTLNYTNDQPEAASNLVLTMPVPGAVALVDGSVNENGAEVTYSADGGKTFAGRSAVMVVGQNGVLQQARANDITHVRWLVAGPVTPGQGGKLSFKGVLE